MNHRRRMRRALTEMHHGGLDAATRVKVECHVSHCADCREVLYKWETADRLLHAARPELVALVPAAAQTLLARALDASHVERLNRASRSRFVRFAWTLGLTCVVATHLLMTVRRMAGAASGEAGSAGNCALSPVTGVDTSYTDDRHEPFPSLAPFPAQCCTALPGTSSHRARLDGVTGPAIFPPRPDARPGDRNP